MIFFNDTATTEIYTLSLHDALPISRNSEKTKPRCAESRLYGRDDDQLRSEEHTSELQSRLHLVCRLLLSKIKKLCLHCQQDRQQSARCIWERPHTP